MKLKNVLLVYTKPKDRKQKNTLDYVKKVIKKYGINCLAKERFSLKQSDFSKRDLIVTLGGDGTFLRASHFVYDVTPFFGINLDPSCKEGFFTVARKEDFDRKLKKVIAGKYKTKKLHRVQAYIDGKKIKEAALNEYYVAPKIQYHTARYYMTIRGKRERQKSSGVLVAAPAGTYAWVKSAGGKELPLFSEKFEYIIREPYCGRTAAKCTLFNGVMKKNEKITIEFEVGKGIIIADSTATEHTFTAGQKVTIKMSNKPIHTVWFSK